MPEQKQSDIDTGFVNPIWNAISAGGVLRAESLSKAAMPAQENKMMKRRLVMVAVTALLLVLAQGVRAGGWAVIVLDEPLGAIHAGESYSVGFTVMQHGQTPVHRLGDGLPIEPLFTATNTTTGDKIEATGVPTKEIGHFVVEVTFPSEGTWDWNIEPAPLIGDTVFEPLTVLPALPVASQAAAIPGSVPAGVAGELPIAGTLRWLALAVAIVAVVLAIRYVQRRRAAAVAVES